MTSGPSQPSRRRVLSVGVGLGVASLTGCAPSSSPSGEPTPSRSPSSSPRASASQSSSAAAEPVLRFVVGSDAHFGEKGTDSRQHLSDFVDAVNRVHDATPLDLVVLNGDIGHGGERLLKDAKKVLDGLKPDYLAVPGNHDEVSAETWQRVWGTPENQVQRIGARSIVAVNTSDVTGDYLCADPRWLRSALATEAGQQDVFVFMHITPKTWTRYGIDCPAVRSLLAGTANVRAVFNGHDHDEDGIKTNSLTPYLFDGRIGGHWGVRYHGFRLVEAGTGRLSTRMLSVSGEEFAQKVVTYPS